MPSTYAHRRFGADVLGLLPADTAEMISRHRELYDIGLHGPDILFYYHALKSNPVSRLGNAMHDEAGEVFFAKALRRIPKAADKDAALCYVLGFICHFALDSTCHPFVERYTRSSGVSHCEIETEFDNALMRRDGLDPLKFFTAGHIKPSFASAQVIKPFFDGVTLLEIYDSLKGMVLVHRGLQAGSEPKRRLILAVMRAAGKYEGMHGLVANPKPNSDCAASNKRLDELYAEALPLAARLISEYTDALRTGRPLDRAYKHTFGEF